MCTSNFTEERIGNYIWFWIYGKLQIFLLNRQFDSYRRFGNGTLASLQTRSRLQWLTSSFLRSGHFRNGSTCNVLSGLRARLNLSKLCAPRNIPGSRTEIILSERSNSSRDGRSRSPAGILVKRFFARFNRVNVGICWKVSAWRLSRPQFAHSKR